MALDLVRIPVDMQALRTYAVLTGTNDDEGSYALHHAMRRVWGDVAPQPFHPTFDGPEPNVVGYVASDARMTRRTVQEEALRVFGEPERKNLPFPLASGDRHSFRIRVRPLVRYGRDVADRIEKETGRRPPSEMDAVQAETMRTGRQADASAVTRSWIERRFGEAASIEAFTLHDYAHQRVSRPTHGPAGMRSIAGSTAIVTGTLRIEDEERFRAIVARGVGRHAAFGYGMLMLGGAQTRRLAA